MNRRQRRALAKKFPGYKKLLKESIDLTFNEFQEMLRKDWEKQGLTETEKYEITRKVRRKKKMEQIETIELVNNSIVSAIDKLHPAAGDMLIFRIRVNEQGDPASPHDMIKFMYDFTEKFLQQNYDNVKVLFLPENIRLDTTGQSL